MKETTTRSYFESLSTAELISLAENNGIDIPQDLERIFIIEELLECTSAKEQEPKEDIQINPSVTESVELPKQYNISFVDIVIRDPLWIFVFWEIKEHDKEIHEKASDFNGYCLRVIPLNENFTASKALEDSFTIPVSTDDRARYIGFADFADHSSVNTDTNCFRIKLSAIRTEEEFQIAVSQPFRMPRLITNEEIHKINENPLCKLSGIEDLPVIIDRGQ